MGSVTSDPSRSEDSAAKKDSLPLSGKNKRELVRPALLPLSSPLTVRLVFPHSRLTTVEVYHCFCVDQGHCTVLFTTLSFPYFYIWSLLTLYQNSVFIKGLVVGSTMIISVQNAVCSSLSPKFFKLAHKYTKVNVQVSFSAVS